MEQSMRVIERRLGAASMNHWIHSKVFYFWNILDAAIVFPIVAIANGLLYRRIVGVTDGENAGR